MQETTAPVTITAALSPRRVQVRLTAADLVNLEQVSKQRGSTLNGALLGALSTERFIREQMATGGTFWMREPDGVFREVQFAVEP